jgi:hypothetical protein
MIPWGLEDDKSGDVEWLDDMGFTVSRHKNQFGDELLLLYARNKQGVYCMKLAPMENLDDFSNIEMHHGSLYDNQTVEEDQLALF